jgi:hypothetical protein
MTDMKFPSEEAAMKENKLIGLIVIVAAIGAVLGVLVGYVTFTLTYRPQGISFAFTYWLEARSADAWLWALAGAFICGAAVYCYHLYIEGVKQ